MSMWISDKVPTNLHREIESTFGEASAYAQLLQVQDKATKRMIQFAPLPMQSKIFRAVEAGHKRIAVVKARQVAGTTGCKLVIHHLAVTCPHEAMHAIVSMRADSASKLLDDHRRWADHPPEILKRPLVTSTRSEICFEGGSSIKAFSSRSQTGLRSFSPAACVISEFAYAPDQVELLAQVDAAVGEGLLIIESTIQNSGDRFAEILRGAPENGWHVITLWWYEHPLYTDDDIPSDFVMTPDEKKLQESLDLTEGQIYWRRKKILSIGEPTFRREYPACHDDLFIEIEGAFFGAELFENVDVIEFEAMGVTAGREIETPHREDQYVMGVDVAGGIGGDYSTMAVVSVSTRQPVYTKRSNSLAPHEWAHECIKVATKYNSALILAESNNHGHAFIQELAQCGYSRQWRDGKTKKPWVTTQKSKIEIYDILREYLSDFIKVLDRVTYMELRSLIVPSGKITPEAPKGSYDDSAIAIALAFRCLSDLPSVYRTTATAHKGRIDTLIKSSRARKIRAKKLPF